MRLLRCGCALLCLLCVSLVAQNTIPQVSPTSSHEEPFHIILDGAHKAGDCMLEGRSADREMRDLHYPAGWTVAIMCTPVRWEEIVQRVNPPRTHAAFTRLRERITVVNGAIFREFPSHAHHILAHELAHIRCQCGDENYVETLASKLEKTHGEPGLERAGGGKAAPPTSGTVPNSTAVPAPSEALH